MADPAASILERLAMVPEGSDAPLVIRHAEREEIPTGSFGHDVSLTVGGSRAAEKLGAALSERRALSVMSSPVPRCVQSAQGMLRGAGSSVEVVIDRSLGGPGAFVTDAEIAGPLFLELPIPEIARRQLHDEASLPGMRPTPEGVEILLEMATSPLGENGRLHVFLTHDIILSVLVASIFHSSLEETGWPGYLEGLLLWRPDGELHASWQGRENVVMSARLDCKWVPESNRSTQFPQPRSIAANYCK